MTSKNVRSCLLLAALLLACGSKILKPVSRPDGERGRDASAASDLALGPSADFGVAPPGGDAACVSETHAAQRTAVDLLFLVDVSQEMVKPWSGMLTKQKVAQQALFDFVGDSKSAGLGVALQYYPFGYLDKPCLEFDDCGHDKELMGGPTVHLHTCIRRRHCQVNGMPPGTYLKCNGGLGTVPGLCGCDVSKDMCGQLDKNSTCVAPGECSVSHKLCPEVGKPCADPAEGMCLPVYGRCFITGRACSPAMYEKLRVPFVDLPGGSKRFLDALDLTETSAGQSAPLVQGVQGSLAVLKKRAAAPGARAGALVLVTSGVPATMGQECAPADPLAARPDLEAASKGTPSLPTYVVGVVSAKDSQETAALNQLAAAGGTGQAFVLDGSMDVAKGLHEALAKIRSATLACDFALPTPKMGALDVARVNVAVKTSQGVRDLAYVGSADRCSDAKGGWHYDADPAKGGQPKRVVLCAASCTAARQDAESSVDVAFGCQSRLE